MLVREAGLDQPWFTVDSHAENTEQINAVITDCSSKTMSQNAKTLKNLALQHA